MKCLKIAERVNQWVEKKGLFPFTVYNDLIPYADKDGAALRHDPRLQHSNAIPTARAS